MKNFLKVAVLTLALLPMVSFAQMNVPQGGTGLTSVPAGSILVGSTSLRLTHTTSPIVSAITIAGEYISDFTDYVRSLFSETVPGLDYNDTTGVLSLTANYNIPLTASTTQWSTAFGWGNHASAGYLTGNQTITLSGDVSGSGATSITTTVADDSHAHTGSTLSGIDISADTNLTAGDHITLTNDDLDIDDDFLLNTGDTGSGSYIFTGTTTHATSSIANLSLTNLLSFNGVTGNEWSDFCTTITGGSGLCDGTDNTGGAPAWGTISGTLSDQADLQSALDAKQNTLTTGNLTESISGLEFDNTRQVIGGAAALSLTSGYIIPLSASTTNWNTFYNTPSNRITAGTGIDWNGNTLDVTIVDTNTTYTAGDHLTLTGTDFDVDDDFLLNTGDTASGAYIFSGTTTLATTTSPNLSLTNLLSFDGVSGNQWSDFCVSITGSSDLCDGNDAAIGGGVSFGTDSQVPYTNLLGTDFDYSDNLVFDGTNLTVNGTATADFFSASGGGDSDDWNTAFGWGDHAGEGYLTGVNWGDIGGTLSDQSDLQTALNAKQDTLTTGNLTEGIAGLEFNNTRQVIGGAAQLSLSSGYVIPLSASTTEWSTAYASTTALTPAYIRGLFSETVPGLDYSSGVLSLTSGYIIPLSASTTNWNNFYDTPSTRITAGTGIDWTGNTLDVTIVDTNTTYTAGDHLTLTGTDFDVDDDFVLNTGDTINGLLTVTGTSTLATSSITSLSIGSGNIDMSGSDIVNANLIVAGSAYANNGIFYVSASPDATDSATLGSGSEQWSDLFLASGGIINWANGNYTATHSSDLLTLSGSLTIATGKNFRLGTTQWNSGDSIDGEVIANDTIDDDSIDFSDVTLSDLTFDVGSVDTTEFGYLNGVTSAIQTQLDAKFGTAGRSLSSSGVTIDADAELYTDTKCAWIESPTDTDDLKSIWKNGSSGDYTLTAIWGESDQTVAFDLQIDDGTPADVNGTDITPAAGEAEDTSLSGDTTLAAGEELDLAITSVTSAPTWVSICWTYTKND